MGEKKEVDFISRLITSDTLFGLNFPPNPAENPFLTTAWLNKTDCIILENMDCPFAIRADEISKSARNSLKRYSLLWRKDMNTARKLYDYGITSDSTELGLDSESELCEIESNILDDTDALVSFINKIWEWKQGERNNKINTKKKFPLKYKDNTFFIGQKSALLNGKTSFASFCDYFYSNCTTSGKLALTRAAAELHVSEPQIRQWISDFNRWARRPANFETQIGQKGSLLRVRDKHIERLK